MVSVPFQGKPFNITVIQVLPQPPTPKKLKLSSLWRLTRPFRTNTKKRCPFCHKGLECKSKKLPGVTGKFGLGVQNKAGKRLTEIFQENSLVIANTLRQQHKRTLYTWTSPDGQHQNQIAYILWSQRWRSSIQSAKARPGADGGSDHELLNVKFRIKWGKPIDHSGMT